MLLEYFQNLPKVEYLGTLATLIVILSFTWKNTVLIRTTNMIGALVFILYAYFIQAPSVLLLNSVLVVVHIYHLSKEYQDYKEVNKLIKQLEQNKRRKGK